MKNVLKSTLATTAGLSAVMATSVAAAATFNVVIDKIELVDNASDVAAGEGIVTVYEPEETTTVNLFNASQAAGTSFKLKTPEDGVYDSAVITFSTVEVSATNSNNKTDYAGVLVSSGLAYDVALGDEAGTTKLVIGANPATASTNELADVLSAADSAGPARNPSIQAAPIVVEGGKFTLPTLNIKLPAASVEDTATSFSLTAAPVVSAIAPKTSANSEDVKDLLVGVDLDVFDVFAGVTGFTSGTSVINVGLFTAATAERPLMQKELATSKNYAKPTSGTTVTFTDVAGTVCPVAWFDANSNDLLDAGESITVHATSISANCVDATGTDANADGVSEYSDDLSKGVLDEDVIALAPREITVSVPARLFSETTAADGNASTGSAIIATAGANVTATANLAEATASELTISIANDAANSASLRRVFKLSTLLGNHTEAATTGNITGNINPTDVVAPVLNGTAQFDAISGVSYADGATNTIVISGVPVFNVDTYAETAAAGNAEYDIKVDFTYGNTSVTTEDLDETAGTFANDATTFADDAIDLGDLN